MKTLKTAYAITDDTGEIESFMTKNSNTFQRRIYKDKSSAQSVLSKLKYKQGYRIIKVLIIPDIKDLMEWCPCCGADLPPNHLYHKE